jgi:hypothetical protein
MKAYERVLEMRGMPRIDIINYIISIGGKSSSEGKFIGDCWEVEIGEEEVITLGSIKIPSRKVTFRSDEEIVRQMISAFRLRFLSAGG